MRYSKFAGKYASPGFQPVDVPWGSAPPMRRSTERPPSLNAADTAGAYAAKRTADSYTGTECLGVAVMHKSCLQPVFNQQSAIDSARMRRG